MSQPLAISRLGFFRVRNLADQEMEARPGLNLLTGANAAGKTSVLEAIHVLARASSFRASRIEQVIRRGASDLVVAGAVVGSQGRQHQLGVQRGTSQTRVRIDQQDVRNLSELARCLPVQVINTESHRLLNDGPKVRRSFLNWSVFHVEHEYDQAWRRYDRALRQRNAALRQADRRLAASWEAELAAAAAVVDAARGSVVRSLGEVLEPLLATWLPEAPVTIDYRRGWPSAENDLGALLKTNRDRELELGYTVAGPHRADLAIRANGVEAQHWLSRGQQKTLTIALLLAQSRLIARRGATPVLLIDDLGAELDADHVARVLREVAAGPAQSFITAISKDVIPVEVQRWMHISEGRLQEMV